MAGSEAETSVHRTIDAALLEGVRLYQIINSLDGVCSRSSVMRYRNGQEPVNPYVRKQILKNLERLRERHKAASNGTPEKKLEGPQG